MTNAELDGKNPRGKNPRGKNPQLKAHSRWLKIMGVEHFAAAEQHHKSIKQVMQGLTASKQEVNIAPNVKQPKFMAKQVVSATKQAAPEISKKSASSVAELSSRHLADEAKNIDDLKNTIESFNGCELKKFARNTVFAEGVSDSEVMFIGEAPGATEDEKGVPFCGQSGQLLDNMLASIGLDRHKNAYITNTIFWRPPGNRRPSQDEIDTCRPFVEKHIALAQPKLIVLVGSTAASSLLGKHEGISKIRSNFYNYKNDYLAKPIAMTAIFHPAYLLRQPGRKKDSWFDLLRIKHYIDEKIATRA